MPGGGGVEIPGSTPSQSCTRTSFPAQGKFSRSKGRPLRKVETKDGQTWPGLSSSCVEVGGEEEMAFAAGPSVLDWGGSRHMAGRLGDGPFRV